MVGVETDAWGHGTALRLSHNKLSGTISEKISKLTGLQHLDLSWNDLGGEISRKVGTEVCSDLDNLLELETINFGHNRLRGDFMPINWYKLERLQRIDPVSYTHLGGLASQCHETGTRLVYGASRHQRSTGSADVRE